MLSAEKMQFLRRLHNLSQTAIGKEIGCSKNLVSMVENRKQSCSEEWQNKYIKAIYKLAEQKKKKDVFKETEQLKEEIDNMKENEDKSINTNK